MSVFQQTEDGDLFRPATAKSFARVNGIEQARQHMRSRLRIFRREVISDERIGLAFFELIVVPNTPTNAIANHVASVILGTPGIVEAEIDFDFEPIRGILLVEGDVVFDVEDQRERVRLHEVVQITRGGGTIVI